MATEFTKEQIAAFNDAFELFDRSGGKRLVAWTECANLARCFGYNPTNQYVLHLLGGDEIDTMPKSQLAEKTIGLDDFLPHLWTISQAPDPGCYEEFFEGLKVFDKDGSGKVSANELRHVLTQLGEKLDSKDCDKLLDGHEDADGNVKYDHFIKTILSDKEEAKE
jgi:myosin light chain 6